MRLRDLAALLEGCDGTLGIRDGLRVLSHLVRRHHVRHLGYPLTHRRIWCYDCRCDVVHWPPNDVCMSCGGLLGHNEHGRCDECAAALIHVR